MFLKIGILKKVSQLLESLFNKDTGLQACNSITNRHQLRSFPVNIARFLKTAFYVGHGHFRWLLLKVVWKKCFSLFSRYHGMSDVE